MPGGLGKGLHSLIPDYYDEDFDSNGAQSLEDMLNEDQDSTNKSSEDNVDNISESSEDIANQDDSNVADDTVEKDVNNENNEKKVLDNEIQTEDVDNNQKSEDLSSNQSSEEIILDTQEVKKQENVAEVLDIVDKNPRITLWSSRSAAVFRYLRKTEPEFSISREASILIDEAVSKKYPEIWKLFDNL